MSEAPPPREVILYVKSKKAVTSFYRGTAAQLETTTTSQYGAAEGAASSGGTNLSPDLGSAAIAHVLPDEQSRALALLEEIAPHRGYSIKVIDVSRSGGVRQLLDSHLSGVESYPVLVQPATGKRIEGPDAFTEKGLLDLLPADLPHIRAFTQLKVSPSKVNEIRSALLAFDPVKEVHLITGDWDVYCVLEFPASGASGKRQVFDFVLQKLAKVPGVEDMSTMIPEYSVTKFPI
jgi:hypothetical protein